MSEEYTEYDGTEYATPQLDVYDENWRRLVLLSDAAFAEVSAERGLTVAPFAEQSIVCGPIGTLSGRVLAIETITGDEPTPKSNFNQERIQTDFVLRSGSKGSPAEQKKRCAADTEIIKRVIKKVLGLYVHELTAGWPADSGNNIYTPPIFNFISIQQFPLAEEKEREYGYSGGVRLNLFATYHQIYRLQ